eukprot:TRINITY_DN9723_c0_g1_i1.p1 TRINITY_DN9723_c0_g1~~TRINITY_DN9723_c0_g1_i1.p1  ORF type:complete len:253 (+),score=-16.73 TRINITY_DN9723_c0_g1_i1:334-1092(+)
MPVILHKQINRTIKRLFQNFDNHNQADKKMHLICKIFLLVNSIFLFSVQQNMQKIKLMLVVNSGCDLSDQFQRQYNTIPVTYVEIVKKFEFQSQYNTIPITYELSNIRNSLKSFDTKSTKNQPQPFPPQSLSQAISTKHQQQYVNLTLFGLRQNPKIFLAGVLQSTQMQNYKILITKYHKQNWKLSKCIHRLPIIILNRKQTVKQTSDWSVLVAYSFHNHQNTQILVEVHTTKNQRMSQTLINYSQQLILTL